VDAEWLASHLDDEDVVVGDVRGPNAHMRGHIPGSRPLVLGSPPPGADESTVAELAKEVALRLRRHGITGNEKLVLVDRGDGVGAMPALQLAELAGHRNVAILVGGIAGWESELAQGAVELEPVREAALEPNPAAFPTRQELAARLDDPALTILDVRREDEYTGRGGSACDPRQGHIPGARRLQVDELFGGDGRPLPADRIRELEDDGVTLVDTTMRAAELLIAAAPGHIRRIALTHGHGDHVGSLDMLKQRLPEVEVLMPELDAQIHAGERAKTRGSWPKLETTPDARLKEGDRVGSLEVVATPGHTPGHVSFLDTRDRAVIAGDVVTSYGRVETTSRLYWRFPFATTATWDKEQNLASAQKLRALEPRTLYVGHGPVVGDPLPAIDRALGRAQE
jgi:glyoxylase-like metal-dependent hydrolase (beta-lactamase superfamily II)